MTGIGHSFQCRIYYEDTDHGGVVYYANYLKFMERGRTEYLRATGVELDDVEREFGVMFAVTEANIRYISPARFNDLIEIESKLIEAKGARLAFLQSIWSIDRNDGVARNTLLSEAEIRLACIDRNGAAKRIPPALLPSLRIHQSS